MEVLFYLDVKATHTDVIFILVSALSLLWMLCSQWFCVRTCVCLWFVRVCVGGLFSFRFVILGRMAEVAVADWSKSLIRTPLRPPLVSGCSCDVPCIRPRG